MFVCSLDLSRKSIYTAPESVQLPTDWGDLKLEWDKKVGSLLSISFSNQEKKEGGQHFMPSDEMTSFLMKSPIRLGAEATVFQMRVWRAAMRIPPGKTDTYGGLAAKLGQPKASRAVGRALALNPYALLIPCHRVVPANGTVGQYRWDAERKENLLKAELGGVGAWEYCLSQWSEKISSLIRSSVA